MIIPLVFDRLASPTVVWALLAYLSLQLREVHQLAGFAALGLSTAWWLNSVVHHVVQEHKIDSRGLRAPAIRSYTPFNLGLLVQAIYYFSKHQNQDFWWKIFRTRGNKNLPYTCEGITAGQRIIFTADEENIKAILATQFGDYGKGPQFRKEWKDFLGLSIFTTDGDLWHNSRTLIRPQFIKDRVSDLQTFEHHVQNLLPLLAGTHDGATVRFDDLLYRYTLDAITDFLLGHSVDSLKNGQAEFATAFATVQNIQAIIARAGPMKDLVPKRKFHEALAVMNAFVGRYIDLALALPPQELQEKTKSDDGYTFLHALAAYTRDRQVLRDQLVAVLLAGRDTTAMTMSWLFYELSNHPEVVAKLREEILKHVGADRAPTYDDLKNMRYLQHTLNEALRLYPAVPYNVRVALKDTTLPHGGGPDGTDRIGITEGTPIGYSTVSDPPLLPLPSLHHSVL